MSEHLKVQQDLRGFILIVIAVAWLSGVLLESWLALPQLALLIGAAIALVCIILFWRDRTCMLVSLIILWLLLGAWRLAISSPVGDPQSINSFIGAGKVELQGMVADDPKLLEHSRLLLVTANKVSMNNGSSWQDAHGRIDVVLLGSFIDDPYGPNYGDDVELKGKLEAPPPHSTPDIFASTAQQLGQPWRILQCGEHWSSAELRQR